MEKELKCDICSFVTRHKASLYTHKKNVHTKSNIFECDQCNQRFSSKHGMESHENAVHNGQVLICKQCDYKTGYKGSLKGHIERMHTKPSTKCPICSWVGNIYSLAHHTKKAHGHKSNFTNHESHFHVNMSSSQ